MNVQHFLTDTSFSSYTEGSYGRVFVDEPRLRAVKLFHRGKKSVHVAEVFEAEFRAYELVQKSPQLLRLTPVFYGKRLVSGVIDGQGTDVSDWYELNLAFELEFVPEHFEKIIQFGERGEEVRKAFLAEGIKYTVDASAAIRADGRLCVIDFATHYVEPFHED